MTVDEKKKFSFLYKEARQRAKRNHCALCQTPITSFERSHSIPRAILNNIANQGWLTTFEQAVGIEEQPAGIRKAGTFFLLCYKCEHKFFNHYEDLQQLKEKPSDILLAEIALKNSLFQLYDSMIEKQAFSILSEEYPNIDYYSNRILVVERDITCFEENISFYQKLVDNEDQGCFQLLYWKLLPYSIPIAIQAQIPIGIDPYGNKINNNYDYFERTESMHYAAFPLQNQSIILAFYHKRDKKLRVVRNLFKRLSNQEILKYLNYIALGSTSNIYFSQKIEPILDSMELRKLLMEFNGLPDFGNCVQSWKQFDFVKTHYGIPQMEDIPCFLDKTYSI